MEEPKCIAVTRISLYKESCGSRSRKLIPKKVNRIAVGKGCFIYVQIDDKGKSEDNAKKIEEEQEDEDIDDKSA
jgi:hypothetical protein